MPADLTLTQEMDLVKIKLTILISHSLFPFSISQQRQSSIGSNQGGASGQQVQLQQLNNNQPNQQPPQQQQQQQLMLLLQQQQQLKLQQLNAAQQQQQQQVPNNNNQMPNQQQQQQVPTNNNMMQGGMQQNQMNSQQQQQIQKVRVCVILISFSFPYNTLCVSFNSSLFTNVLTSCAPSISHFTYSFFNYMDINYHSSNVLVFNNNFWHCSRRIILVRIQLEIKI